MNTKTALVLDDNDLYRTVLTYMLKKKKIAVSAFPDPESYLATRGKDHCAKNCPCFDIILTDNHMLSMSGLEFLEWGKHINCKLPAQRKAIISSLLTDEDRDRAEQLGCQVFDKNSQLDNIRNWVDQWTEAKRESKP